MELHTVECLNSINEKIGWAERSFNNILSNISDENTVKDNFWSYLTAINQTWNYFSKWVFDCNKKRNIAPGESSSVKIERWKSNSLNAHEIDCWNLIRELRNTDTHQSPMSPNYQIVKKVLRNQNGKILTNSDGKLLASSSEYLNVIYNDRIYDIRTIGTIGLDNIRKLIEYIKMDE